MIHNPAPAIENGPGPYVTPGVRGRWWTAGQWLSVMRALHSRRASAAAYRQQTAHMDELARHPHAIATAELADLSALRKYLAAAEHTPTRGRRGGTSWERILNVTNNTIAHRIQLEQLEADVRREQAELLKETEI